MPRASQPVRIYFPHAKLILIDGSLFLSVAIAYTMQKAPFSFPIIGGRKVEHLHANIEALSIHLSEEHIKTIESVVPFDKGFPSALIVSFLEQYKIFSVRS